MKFAGFALFALGIIALVYGGISYSRQRSLIGLGPILTTVTEQKSIPLSPFFGAILVVGGIVLLASPRRRAMVPSKR